MTKKIELLNPATALTNIAMRNFRRSLGVRPKELIMESNGLLIRVKQKGIFKRCPNWTPADLKPNHYEVIGKGVAHA